MEAEIVPALTRDEWQVQRKHFAAMTRVEEGVRLAARYDDGESVTVNGADNLWRLIAIANDALPNSDPRKITLEDVHLLNALAASMEVRDADLPRLLPLVDALCDKVRALCSHR